MTDDAIPEPIAIDERSKRKTIEFCCHAHGGYRCMLVKGHGSVHEAIGNRGPLRWIAE